MSTPTTIELNSVPKVNNQTEDSRPHYVGRVPESIWNLVHINAIKSRMRLQTYLVRVMEQSEQLPPDDAAVATLIRQTGSGPSLKPNGNDSNSGNTQKAEAVHDRHGRPSMPSPNTSITTDRHGGRRKPSEPASG